MPTYAINLTIHTENQNAAFRVVEMLARPLVGFALEDDLYTNLSVMKMEDETVHDHDD